MAQYSINLPDEIAPEKARTLIGRLEAELADEGFVFFRVPPDFPMECMPEVLFRLRHWMDEVIASALTATSRTS